MFVDVSTRAAILKIKIINKYLYHDVSLCFMKNFITLRFERNPAINKIQITSKRGLEKSGRI